MASERAVRAALTMLGRVFAGSVGPERIETYCAALEDLSDGEVADATKALMTSHLGEFIPVPAVIRQMARGDETPRLDVDRIVREISAMGEYNPHCGWQPPSVRRVRAVAGHAIADAYADVGASRLFLGGARTREIAAQEFRKSLALATGAHLYASFPPWAVANPARLAAGEPKRLRYVDAAPVARPRDPLEDS